MMLKSIVLASVAALSMAACSGDDESSSESAPVTVTESTPSTDADDEPFTQTTGEMRPVPTVPPSTIEGQTGDSGDGVIEVAPTLVPPPPPEVDPDEPATTPVPPTTELVGDPQPSPDTTQPPPPPTVEPAPAACERLDPFGIDQIVADEGGSAATSTDVDESTCLIESGSVSAEVFFVPVDQVRNDWYLRSGIEPVGEVGEEAVGFSSYLTPDGRVDAGYTIAVAGGREGVIVAVTGTSDARLVAIDVMIFANQAA
ncbi:hypothetical protein [Ilumatobacter coccineus]|uniref:hypothetical protein n=1 Tax=Ilumatobacter coccineus TaxID=467094 RepID=UPI00138B166A|nr:hypothetical protein [Ilumatobacter coccineus]